MAITEGIEFCIVSKDTGKALVEYENPYAVQLNEELLVEKFIETTNRLECQVEISFCLGFEYNSHVGLIVELTIDDGTVMEIKYYPPREVTARMRDKKAIIQSNTIYNNEP